MVGRIAKPIALRVVQGTPSHKAKSEQKTEIKGEIGLNPAPDYFSEDEKRWYAEFQVIVTGMKVAQISDSLAAEILVTAYSDFRKARDHVEEHGQVVKVLSTAGVEVMKANPSCAIMAEAWKRFRGLTTEFGLSPAARTKVSPLGKSDDDLAGDLMSGKN